MATTGGERPTEPGTSEPPDVTKLTYASAGAELDAIIDEFETGVVDVDRLVEQLERATDIVDELDRRLRSTRLRVEKLVPRLEAIGKGEVPEAGRPDGGGEPFPGGGDPDGSNDGRTSPGLF
jgi:exodeoxyribonuclease VII small subunit